MTVQASPNFAINKPAAQNPHMKSTVVLQADHLAERVWTEGVEQFPKKAPKKSIQQMFKEGQGQEG